MDADEYRAWLGTTWSPERLATIAESRGRRRGERLYTDTSVAALAEGYARLTGAPAVRESLAEVLTTVLQPHLPEGGSRVGIVFRDWPIPCSDRAGLAPEERGDARLPPDIMTGSIGRACALGGRERYPTLRRGFEAAHAIARHVGLVESQSLESFVTGCMVGDLVKIPALFRGMNGSPFVDALSKRSCHSWGMYSFAGEAFAEEVEILGLRFVIAFGSRYPWAGAIDALQRRGWRVEVLGPRSGVLSAVDTLPGSGERRFVLLPHPQAWGCALDRAVARATGGEVQLPQPLAPADAEDLETHVPIRVGAPEEAFYARIEEWLECHFGGWEIEPHNARTMRSFRPQGRLSGAIYNRSPRGRKLVFHCQNREKWLGRIGDFRVVPGDGRRVEVYIKDDTDLSALDALIQDWE